MESGASSKKDILPESFEKQSVAHFIFNTLEQEYPTNVGYVMSTISLVFVFVNILVVVLKTEPLLPQWSFYVLFVIELITTIELFLEIILRLWTSNTSLKLKHTPEWLRRIRFFFTIYNLLDFVGLTIQFVSISFWIMRWIVPQPGFEYLIFVQLIRLTRLLRIQKNLNGLSLIWKVIVMKWRELLMSAFLILTFIFIFAAIIYSIEKDTNPDMMGSIPRAMWYTIISFSTIGYGDVNTSSWLSRAFVACTILIPIAIFAVPVSILGAGVIEEIRNVSRLNEQKQIDDKAFIKQKFKEEWQTKLKWAKGSKK